MSKFPAHSEFPARSESDNMTNWSFNGIYSESSRVNACNTECGNSGSETVTDVNCSPEHHREPPVENESISEHEFDSEHKKSDFEHKSVSEYERQSNSEHDSNVYKLSAASKTVASRVPGFPTFRKSGLSSEKYLQHLEAHLADNSGNEGDSEGTDSDTSSERPRSHKEQLCPCTETFLKTALQQNADVNDSESEFCTDDWASSGYSSSDETDKPYQPHLGTSTRTFPRTPPTEDDKKLSAESEEEECQQESDEEDESEERPKKRQCKQKFRVPTDVLLKVLPMPDWKPQWNLKKKNSMKLVQNKHKLNTLSFFKTGLCQQTIMFDDIPEVDDDMFGRYKFLVVKNSQEFFVCPNVVLGINKKKVSEVYFLAPNKSWYKLEPGSGRDNEYHIPAPLSERKTIGTLLANTYP